MNAKELRDLDAWIAFNVTKITTVLVEIREPDISFFPHYSTDPAAAMEVLKRCAEKPKNGIVGIGSPITCQKWVVGLVGRKAFDVEAPTLELAICQFAKKLFT